MTPLTLSEINIYPVKSLGGMSLTKASVLRKGLLFDRRWMLIDEEGVAMTQREYPEMALLKVRIDDTLVSVDHVREGKRLASTHFPASDEPVGHGLRAMVWGDVVDVLEVDPLASEWFSELLKVRCRLVRFPEKNPRAVDRKYSPHDENVSLADAFPFLIIGQPSLDDLNARLDTPVPMNRFRPNFVFTGGEPFAEDEWREFSIGPVHFLAVKPCGRCSIPTTDQDSARREAEPIRTLSRYRKKGNNVYFGQNLIALSEGEVSVGDLVIPE